MGRDLNVLAAEEVVAQAGRCGIAVLISGFTVGPASVVDTGPAAACADVGA
jgi:hypothetical protein